MPDYDPAPYAFFLSESNISREGAKTQDYVAQNNTLIYAGLDPVSHACNYNFKKPLVAHNTLHHLNPRQFRLLKNQ